MISSVGAPDGAKSASKMENDVKPEQSTESAARYSWSFDEEHYRGEEGSREDALSAAMAEADDRAGCLIGRAVPIKLETLTPDGWGLIEGMQERAYDAVSEHDWLDDVTKEQEADLEASVRAAIEAWMDRHKLHARFWAIEDVTEHVFPSSDSETDLSQESASPASSAGPLGTERDNAPTPSIAGGDSQ